jgi:DinB family protein
VKTDEVDFQAAIATLNLTGALVDRAIEQIQLTEWLKRPALRSTHRLWIVGHLAVTRGILAHILGGKSDTPDPLFAGGTPLLHDVAYPPPEAVTAKWRESRAYLDQILRSVAVIDLSQPSPEGVPTFNGRVNGALAASVFHEAYHVGQLGYLMRWLGHPPLLGR